MDIKKRIDELTDDMLQDLAIGLTLRIDFNFLYKAAEERFLLCIAESVIEAVEIEQELIHVIRGDLVHFNILNPRSHRFDLPLCFADLIVQRIQAGEHIFILLFRYQIKKWGIAKEYNLCIMIM